MALPVGSVVQEVDMFREALKAVKVPAGLVPGEVVGGSRDVGWWATRGAISSAAFG